MGARETNTRCDVVVIGGGATGLFAAIKAARAASQTLLVSRKPLAESSSYWAQGGLAAALSPDDSPARHAADTLAAGRGLCRPSAVSVLTEEAPGATQELRDLGIEFDTLPAGGL